METLGTIRAELESLERSNFTRLDKEFVASDGIGECISGAIQFFVLDRGKEFVDVALPVVCAVGVNYTQERKQFIGKLRHFSASDPPTVTGNTGCRNAVALVISAYNRNASVWTSRPSVGGLSPLGVYASSNATLRSRLLGGRATEIQGRFHLIMTNVSPFITQHEWLPQAKLTPDACTKISGDVSHLDELYDVLGSKIDLWIGHSSNSGTNWVWPEFARFVQRHRIEHWMLTGNINPRSHLAFDRQYRTPTNARFPWFAPERPEGGD